MMEQSLPKKNWILLLLNTYPMDRVRIMKALFLIWYRSQRNIPGYFKFKPYLYGPCSFEVYDALDELLDERLVVQLPHSIQKWAGYYLTEKGKSAIKQIRIDEKIHNLIKDTAKEVSNLTFYGLLKQVYKEAPEYTINSVMKDILKQ